MFFYRAHTKQCGKFPIYVQTWVWFIIISFFTIYTSFQMRIVNPSFNRFTVPIWCVELYPAGQRLWQRHYRNQEERYHSF